MRPLRVLLLSAFIVLSAAPASAGTALEATLTLSDVHPGSKGVIYSWDLGVAAYVEASALRVTVADGTSGAPSVYLVDGLPSGTLSFHGNVIDYRFDQPALVPAGSKIIFAVGGLTNPTATPEFASDIKLGEFGSQAPKTAFDLKAGTRAMVFVTAEAARLSRQDPASVRSSTPVLMTNEQESSYDPVSELSSPRFSKRPSLAIVALLMVGAMLLMARRTSQLA